MTLRPILIHPDPRLKKAAEPVTEVTDAIRAAAADMLETMYEAPGVGLAGPQIGLMSRIFVMDCVKDPEAEARPMVLMNPEITWASDEKRTYEEGCLSIPEQYAEVERPARCRVRWLDEKGKTHEKELDGLMATCIQHEHDHLEGILFIDHLSRLKREMVLKKLAKLRKAA